MRRIACAALVLALALGPCNPARAGEISVDTRDGTRSAIVLPAERAGAATVIVLHGALISAEYTRHWYGFAEAAKRHGFAAVFPRGINLLWNDGRNAAWASGADDVGFLKGLVRRLVAGGTADPARLYLVGVSNGGMMTLRMLCEASELFAGAAAIIASMPAEVGAACRLRHPMPVILFNGTADPLVPYGGGSVGFSSWQGTVWPAERTALFLARANGCGAGSKAVLAGRRPPGAIRVVRLEWGRCSSERGVALYRVEGGGHQVYGHTNFFPMFLGPGTRLVSAPSTIMAAFARRGTQYSSSSTRGGPARHRT
jgi:polyhydroxybutyrate depolymerase